MHVRTKPCYDRDDATCNCAVAVREYNHILGVYACQPGKLPVAIRYLEDPLVPGAQLLISPNGKDYTVNDPSLKHTVFIICSQQNQLEEYSQERSTKDEAQLGESGGGSS